MIEAYYAPYAAGIVGPRYSSALYSGPMKTLWNILTYKAPPNNEGYDLICIHPAGLEIASPSALRNGAQGHSLGRTVVRWMPITL